MRFARRSTPGITTAAAFGRERSATDRLGSVTNGERSNVSADVRFGFWPCLCSR